MLFPEMLCRSMLRQAGVCRWVEMFFHKTVMLSLITVMLTSQFLNTLPLLMEIVVVTENTVKVRDVQTDPFLCFMYLTIRF